MKPSYWLSQPGTIFRGHTDVNEMLPGVKANLAAFRRDNKCQKVMLDVVHDRNGYTILEAFGF